MDALDVLKVCLRRWYVGLPIVLLAAVVGAGLSQDRSIDYSGSASIALIYETPASQQPNTDGPLSRNPLAGNNGSLLYEAILADLNSPQSQLEIARGSTSGVPPTEAANGSRFSAYVPQDKQSITVAAYGTDPTAVRTTVDRAVAATTLKAKQIQDRAGVPPAGQLTTFLTVGTQLSSLPPASPTKLIAAVVAVGVLAAAALSILVDRLMSRRRKRTPRHAGTSGAGDPEEEPAAATGPSTAPAPTGEPTAGEASQPTAPPDGRVDDPWEDSPAPRSGFART